MPSRIDVLAKAIHDTWRKLAADQGWGMQPRFDKEFEKLSPDDQDDNRAAAQRIPWILGLAGLGVESDQAQSSTDAPNESQIREQLESHMERLAEAEHDGWMQHRLNHRWSYGPKRDDEKQIHPLLIPYSKLPEAEKEKDRNTVRHFPEFVRQAGHHIVWVGSDVPP